MLVISCVLASTLAAPMPVPADGGLAITPDTAMCGGGGGGMQREPPPSWTDENSLGPSSGSNASPKAGNGRIYVLSSKTSGKRSIAHRENTQYAQTFAFINLEGDAGAAKARAFGVASLPAVVFTDRHGNVLSTLNSSEITGARVAAVVKTLPQACAAAEQQVKERATRARAATGSAALALWRPLATMRGYAETDEARTQVTTLEAAEKAKLEAARTAGATPKPQ